MTGNETIGALDASAILTPTPISRADMQSSTSCVSPESSVGITHEVLPLASTAAFSVSFPSSMVGTAFLPAS